jgi:hypothetical protein
VKDKRTMRSSGTTGLPIFLSSCVFLSCSRPAAPTWQGADPATWREIRRVLEVERAAGPLHPWAAGVRMAMRESRSGRAVDGRGAIAVAPGRALRMILVGPAGATMLDAWVTPGKWRIAVPPASLVRRGDDGSEPGELPVGFLRWSFFRPLAGTLFAGSMRGGRVLFVLRDDDAVLEVRLRACDRGELTMTTRRAHGRVERLDQCRATSTPLPGDWARYEDETGGLRVDLTLESVAEGPPEEDAFRDPDGTFSSLDHAAGGVDGTAPSLDHALARAGDVPPAGPVRRHPLQVGP